MKYFLSKILILLTITNIIISCNEVKSEDQLSQFDFDTVELYSTIKKDSIISNINKKRFTNLTQDEKLYLDILEKNVPTNFADESFVLNLEKLKFKKRVFDKSKLKEFKKIFSKKFCYKIQENGCTPMYRDIYIFRKNNQITGIAKVCFQCQIVYFISKNYNWQRFGECENYKLLEQI